MISNFFYILCLLKSEIKTGTTMESLKLNLSKGVSTSNLAKPKNNETLVNYRKKDTQSFAGVQQSVVKFADLIAAGGLAVSFTVQDMLGTNFPRTIVALNRNKGELGHYNYEHAVEVGLREFITGPSLFTIPALALFVAGKAFGSSLKVPVDSIEAYGEILKNSVENTNLKNSKDLKNSFYSKLFENVLKNAGADDTLSKDNMNMMGLLKKLDESKNKKDKKVNRQNLIDQFIIYRKQHSENSSDNFLKATIKLNDNKKARTINFETMLSEAKDFIDDASKTLEKKLKANEKANIDELVEKFVKQKKIGRGLLNVSIILLLCSFCALIPKIYTRSKENPALAGIVETNQVNSVKQPEETLASEQEVNCEA